ncbi:hypothetical protein BN7_5551 [Wickerhamomyces ciferrii]|uniref:Zn(2)-C6 fungal-type domain-containing protein n=1 Tax=Wickerhamomyces ciferrii (strain ATCC 14091 / BCRC 22168 / CBS 111 / JCM 3599 / NBRC 0793 / NRRL Y-1031 F-60-10) TaxID=1206466 RepID=K0KWU7_WICCF|nr:uncharacterized protein BN7_5551 [Wickerhamomyces ciferrii]CCH45964.1 hypothetical protein BN7_5551 [Wickerhamomyces ciferrii]
MSEQNNETNGTPGSNTSTPTPIDTTKRSLSNESNTPKPKRKRKTFSCTTCRKLKTRCDFNKFEKKCYRCNILKLECSLTGEGSINQLDQDKDSIELKNENSELNDVNKKLNLIMDHLNIQTPTSNPKPKPSKTHKSIEISPFKLISQISKPLTTTTQPSTNSFHSKSLEILNKIYKPNQEICLSLSNNFLTKAHYWIIPGGLTQIDHNYTQQNPFITLVFILISLSFDHKEIFIPNEDYFQSLVFQSVKDLIGLSMLYNDDLTDHDLEGMVYLCSYQVVRTKSMQSGEEQKQWDYWILSGHVLKLIMKHFKFNKIKERIDIGEYLDLDLFHLRIWNALCCCHFGICLGFGMDLLINDEFLKYCELILKFPEVKLEDEIKFIELGFLQKCFGLINDEEYLIQLGQDIKDDLEIIEFKSWKLSNQKIIDEDFSQILKFCYDYFHICFLEKLQSIYPKQDYTTRIKTYLFELIDKFIKLDHILIKGSPNYLMNQLIYTCFKMMELMNKLTPDEQKLCNNNITKIYWRLNQIGEDQNRCTMDVGKIIKEILEKTNHDNNEHLHNPLHDEVNHEYSNDGFRLSDERGLNNDGIPNVEMYSSFEDFFKELFK